MALVDNLGVKLGLNQEEINKIINEMKSSDYDNLVKVFTKKFGMVVKVYKNGKLCDYADE
jgi:uncharacterized protein YeeX (DUF496 family)